MDFAADEPPNDVEITIETEPAYDLNGWQSDKCTGPQCSASGEFCFMCVFRKKSDDTPEGESDDVKAIDTLINTLADEGKEIPTIVSTVFDVYNKYIRKTVRYTPPATNMEVKGPSWSTESIQRHIVFSGNYPKLFDSVCGQIFTSTIMKQQNRLCDAGRGGEIIEENRKGLMDTFKHYTSVSGPHQTLPIRPLILARVPLCCRRATMAGRKRREREGNGAGLS